MTAIASYNYGLVAFSFLIATTAAWVAIEFLQNARRTDGAAGIPWLAGAAVVMGVGIWTAHHIGMLALDLDIWIWYSVKWTVGLFIPPIVLAGAAFVALDAEGNSTGSRLLAIAALAAAMLSTSLFGIESIRTGGSIATDKRFVLAGAVTTVLLCAGAIRILQRLPGLQPFALRTVLVRAGAAALFGLALTAAHYLPLVGSTFLGGADGWRPAPERAWGTAGLGIFVAITTMLLLAAAVGMSEIDRWRLGRLVAQESIKQSEGRIRESEQRFQSMIEHASDFIAIVNRLGIVQYASPGHARLFGATDLERRDLERFIHPDDRALFDARLQDLTDQGEGARSVFEYRVKSAEGGWRTFSTDATNLSGDPGVGGIVLNSRDVTDRQSLEDQLRQSQKMDAIGRLAAGVAHDFNNLLTVIRSSSEFLIDDLAKDSRQHADAIEIRQASDRAAALTRQLLAFSRKQLLDPQPLELSEVVSSMLPMISRVINEDIEIVTRQTTRGVLIRADQGQIEQVVLNLVVNARDAMPQGGVLTIETSVTIGCLALEQRGFTGPCVCLQVTDTGLGMQEDIRRQVFDPFFTTKERDKGTGLGLATVYGIVTQSDGQIECRSEPGIGTTFTVLFPVTGETSNFRIPPSGPVNTGTGKVLLVEDEHDVRRVTRRVLERIGYAVIDAANGQEGLALAEQHRGSVRLVVSDVVMPGLDGPSMVRILRDRMPELPVLFVSGYSDQEVQRRRLDLDALHLSKPFSESELADAALEAIRRHEKRSRPSQA